MKITVLIENTTENEFLYEHGLSLLVEMNDKKILLDAGSSELFMTNAQKLGITFDDLDACVLSHGHYDHSGGFEAVFQNNKSVNLYLRESAVNTYYSANGEMHEIGIQKNVLAYKERMIFTDNMKQLFDNVYLIPHSAADLDKIGERTKLYKKTEDELLPDDFEHEQSLVIDTDKGLVIFNSCSHGGMENIVHEVKKVCDNKNVYAYVGGLHMKGTVNGEEICTFSEEELDKLCEFVRKENISHIYTGHCTGIVGYDKLKQRLGNKLGKLTSGRQFQL